MLARFGLLAMFTLVASAPTASALDEWQVFWDPMNIPVYVDWDSFEDLGIDATWKYPVMDAVINVTRRWQQISGAAIRFLPPQFIAPEDYDHDFIFGAILVRMQPTHDGPANAGVPGVLGNYAIVCPAYANSQGTPFAWTPLRTAYQAGGDVSFQDVFMHEFGHAIGLYEHLPQTSEPSVMGNGPAFGWHMGPYKHDLDRLRSVYGKRTDLRFRKKRSTNQGASWHSHSTNLTSLAASTTTTPVAVRTTSETVVFYTNPDKYPSRARGNNSGTSFSTVSAIYLGYSLYGTAGHGDSGNFMMAYVEGGTQRVRVRESVNGGETFPYDRSPPSSTKAVGTPAIHRVDSSHWLLVYSKWSASSYTSFAKIVYRVYRPYQPKIKWGPEREIHDFYRAYGGVSVSSNGANDIRVGFSWEPEHLYHLPRRFRHRTFRVTLSGDTLNWQGTMLGNDTVLNAPSLTRTYQKHLLGFTPHTADFPFFYSRSADPGASSWSAPQVLVYASMANPAATSPAVAASRNLNYAFIYYVTE